MSTPSPAAQRREEEKVQRRTSILDSAEAVVADKGFDALTMGDIAARARLSRSLVYVYFADKEDLGHALAHRAAVDLSSRFERAAMAHHSGLDQIRSIGRAYVRFAKERPVGFEMIAHNQAREANPESIGQNEGAMLRASSGTLHLMADVIRRGQHDGSIRGHLDPVKTSIALWGFMHGMIQMWSMKGAMLGTSFGFDEDAILDHAFKLVNLSLATETTSE